MEKQSPFTCPHCGSTDKEFVAGEKLHWTINKKDELRELYMCDCCEKYYFVHYKFIRTSKLTQEK